MTAGLENLGFSRGGKGPLTGLFSAPLEEPAQDMLGVLWGQGQFGFWAQPPVSYPPSAWGGSFVFRPIGNVVCKTGGHLDLGS